MSQQLKLRSISHIYFFSYLPFPAGGHLIRPSRRLVGRTRIVSSGSAKRRELAAPNFLPAHVSAQSDQRHGVRPTSAAGTNFRHFSVSTGPLARPFARSLASLTRSLAHSFARSLTSLTPLLVGQWMIGWLFCLCFFPFSTIVHNVS